MGILKGIIEKKAKEIIDRKVEENQAEDNIEFVKYNRVWLENMASKTGFAISDNEKRVENILKALNKRDGHCPCGGMTEEFVCPCRMMREHGNCKCGLYQNVVDVEPKDTSTSGKIKDSE